MSPGCLAGRYSGKWVPLVNHGSSQPFGALNQTISLVFYNIKEGPLQVFEAVSLYRPHYGKWRHMPPISYTCVESTDGVDCKWCAATCQAASIGDSPGIRGLLCPRRRERFPWIVPPG
jgi:hypothetical protein